MSIKKLKSRSLPDGKNPLVSPKVMVMSALLLITGNIYAQKGFDFGLKGEVMTSSLLNSTDQAAGAELNYQNKIHGAAGISGGYTFTKHLGAEIDILYSAQGQGYTGDPSKIPPSGDDALSSEFQKLAAANHIGFTGTSYTSAITLDYIKIPLLLRYTGNNTKKIFFSSFIGPQIDILSSANIAVNGDNANTYYSLKSSDFYKKTTVDAVLGLGAGWNLNRNLVLSLHLRLDYGLGDAENKSASYTLPTMPVTVTTVDFYGSGRASTHNATGGGLISVSYKLLPKKKAPAKSAPKKK